MRARRVALGAVLATALAAGFAVPATSASPPEDPGSIGVRLVAAPLASGGPLGRTAIVARLAPGTTLRRRIEISNSLGRALAIAVYPAAADLRRGTFAFSSGSAQNELAHWTTVGQRLVHLGPQSTTFATVTIAVPRRATAGERYAVVWASVGAAASAQPGVRLVNRVGVRIYLTVGRGGDPTARFSIGALRATRWGDGAPNVNALVRNDGTSTLSLDGTLTLSRGPGGLRAGPFEVTLGGGGIAPGGSVRAGAKLDARLPRGPWHAELRLAGGGTAHVAAASLTFPATARHSPAPRAVRAHMDSRVLVALLALIATLLGLAVFHLARRRSLS